MPRFKIAGVSLAGTLLIFSVVSAAAQKDGRPSVLIKAFAEAQRFAGSVREQRREGRDQTLAEWIHAPAGQQRVVIRCPNGSCSANDRETILDRLANAFRRAPVFLQAASLRQVQWEQLPPGARPDGMGKDGILRLYAPPGAPIDILVVHELAHIYFEDRAQDVNGFLSLRWTTDEMRRKVAALRAYLEQAGESGCGPERPNCLDEHARALIAEARVPQRFPDDLHAIGSDTGYWASSMELAFRVSRGEDGSLLTNYFSREEISWLLAKLGTHFSSPL